MFRKSAFFIVSLLASTLWYFQVYASNEGCKGTLENIKLNIVSLPEEKFMKPFLKIVDDRKISGVADIKNRKTVLVLEMPYFTLNSFSEGLLVIGKYIDGNKNYSYAYMDHQGSLISDFEFEEASSFQNGLAVVQKKSLWGAINRKGQFVIEPVFSWVGSAAEGAVVVRHSSGYDYVNVKGEALTKKNFVRLSKLSEGLGVASTSGSAAMPGKFGYVDRSGKTIISFEFDEANTFSQGLAAVKINGKFGYIDKTGKMIIKPQFKDPGEFSENGLAVVRNTSGFGGVINRQGELITDYKFKNLWGFYEGFASYYDLEKHKYGFIDENGSITIEPKFSSIQSGFKNGFASVEDNGVVGFIDYLGNFMLSTDLSQALHGMGMLDLDRQVFVPPTSKIGN